MAARVHRSKGSAPRGEGVGLVSPIVVVLSAVEEERLVEVLALALLPLLSGDGSGEPGVESEGVDGEGGERGAGGDL